MPNPTIAVKSTINGLRIRETAPNGKAIRQIDTPDIVESLESAANTRAKLGVDGQWLKIRSPEGIVGYVAAWLLQAVSVPEPVVQPPSDKRYVRPMQDGLRIREKPVDGKPIGIVGVLSLLESLESAAETNAKVGSQGQWLKVRTQDGVTAYIAAWLVQHTDAPVPFTGDTNLVGMNLDVFHPLGLPDPALLGDLGWVRFGYNVSMGKGSQNIKAAYNTYRPALEKYAKAGKKVLLTFTHQTYGEGVNEFWPWPTMTDDKWRRLTDRFTEMIHEIAKQYAGQGLVHVYQIWNEMDAPIGAAASVPMLPRNYAHLLAQSIRALRTADDKVAVITGGHTRGPADGAAYARDTIRAMPADLRPDGIASHPYGRGPRAFTRYANWGHIEDELAAYNAILPDRPLWFTEWGCLDKEGDPASEIAQYAQDMIEYINNKYRGKVAAAMWYAWAMGMHNGYGLVSRDGRPISALHERFIRLRG